MREVLTFIMAGGKGERLNPLTRDRAKPAVPFGGIYRIIDFTLSNCINSGLRRVFVLIQYKSFSLQKHILSGWDIVSTQLSEFIDVIPPQQRISSDWYKGTADAIYQNIYAIYDNKPEMVLILAGDHIYKMDYRKMIQRHQDLEADVTVACVEAPKESSASLGVVEVDKKGFVTGFQEKPQDPKTIPGKPSKIFASMGIYLFNTKMLVDELESDAQSSSDHDFGKNIIPQMIKSKRKVSYYNFADDEGNAKYWRDIGTRDAYFQANMDLVGPRPEFDLFDKSWPVRTSPTLYPPIKIMTVGATDTSHAGTVIDSLVGGGCIICGAEVKRSVLSPNVKIEDHAFVSDAILMENVTVGEHAKIKNAIIDKEVVIPPHAQIGYNLESDRKKFDVTTSGIIMIAKRHPFVNA